MTNLKHGFFYALSGTVLLACKVPFGVSIDGELGKLPPVGTAGVVTGIGHSVKDLVELGDGSEL